MIVEYDSKYDEQIKDLLVELQNYLIDIDNWHTQIMLPEYREKYFKMDMEKVKNQDGKIYLELENDKVIGLIIGGVEEKDDIDKLTNDCAKTGSVIELIVKNNIRGNGIGKKLLEKLEEYFRKDELRNAGKLSPEEIREIERLAENNREIATLEYVRNLY